MHYEEALKYICKRCKKDKLAKPFFVYSYLSDVCNGDYEDRQSVKIFFDLDKRYKIFDTLLKYGSDGVGKLLDKVNERETVSVVNGAIRLDKDQYAGAVFDIADALGIARDEYYFSDEDEEDEEYEFDDFDREFFGDYFDYGKRNKVDGNKDGIRVYDSFADAFDDDEEYGEYDYDDDEEYDDCGYDYDDEYEDYEDDYDDDEYDYDYDEDYDDDQLAGKKWGPLKRFAKKIRNRLFKRNKY